MSEPQPSRPLRAPAQGELTSALSATVAVALRINLRRLTT